jgi:very-short-patch-repair endonuclease
VDTRTFARGLRRRSTEAETLLWYYLRARRLGGQKFKRQYPVDKYVVDFVCLERKLVIELDGGHHSTQPSDVPRDAWLTAQGFEIVRIWNNDVFGNMPGVLEHISECLRLRQPRVPSP